MTAEYYNLENIRDLLTEGFTNAELRRLCHDRVEFRSVYELLAENTGKAQVVDQLLEYAERKLLIEPLLNWAKEVNPRRFRLHEPYIEKDINEQGPASDRIRRTEDVDMTEKVVLLVSSGTIAEIGTVDEDFEGVGRIVIKPGNAVILERETEISRICGPGTFTIDFDEKIHAVFDLRPQSVVHILQNVLTSDRIPLEIKLGIGYKITPAANPDGPDVIKEQKFGLYPVKKDTLIKAAFNGAAGGWKGFGDNAPIGQLRDQIMAHQLAELFQIEDASRNLQVRVGQRQVKHIEDAILATMNSFADDNIGITYTFIDIREIRLPLEIEEAIQARIKAEFEAEAIRKIETARNEVREQLVFKILNAISTTTGNRIGENELQMAKELAEILWQKSE